MSASRFCFQEQSRAEAPLAPAGEFYQVHCCTDRMAVNTSCKTTAPVSKFPQSQQVPLLCWGHTFEVRPPVDFWNEFATMMDCLHVEACSRAEP